MRFSSFFPFHGDTLLIVPPRSLWPPPESDQDSLQRRALRSAVGDRSRCSPEKPIDEDRWTVDGESECLVPVESGRAGAVSDRAAIQRRSGSPGATRPSRLHSTACLEFARGAGLWTIVQFADEAAAAQWQAPVRSALRLLADSGFGRRAIPRMGPFGSAGVAAVVAAAATPDEQLERARYWLLSLYTPAANEAWTGSAATTPPCSRRGRIESSARWGEPKQATMMIAEGSVLIGLERTRGALPATSRPKAFRIRCIAPDSRSPFPFPGGWLHEGAA